MNKHIGSTLDSLLEETGEQEECQRICRDKINNSLNKYMVIELPDTTATVDFLNEGISIDIAIVDGKLEIRAKFSHGENASTWDVREIIWDIPDYK